MNYQIQHSFTTHEFTQSQLKMEKLSFKTNINCNNCIAKVKPFLNQVENIENWQVDINNADKILSVSGEEELTSTEVIEAVQKAGFKIEVVK